MLKINGVVTALFTPMFSDGKIDYRSLESLIDYNVTNKVGVLSAGTTSESPTIPKEQERIDNIVVSRAQGKVPVIIGAGTNDTEHSVNLTKRAIGNGADATLHVMGYYNKPTQRGVVDYFDRIAAISPINAVIMYHIPGRGAAEYRPEVIAALACDHPNINALKEASPKNVEFATEVRKLMDQYGIDFSIMSGDDDATFRMIREARGDGVISVMSNLLPHMYSKLVIHAREGNPEAAALNQTLEPLNKIVGMKARDQVEINGKVYEFEDTYRNPHSVKTAAFILGITPHLGFRSPLTRMPEEGVRTVGRALWQVYEATDGEAFRPLQEFFRPIPNVGDRLMQFRRCNG